MQILTQNPSLLDWVPCFKGVTITVIIIPLSTHTNHPQWGTKLIMFWQNVFFFFFLELQDLCPVPERTAWQWCLNLFVSELTHSALYTLIHRWRKKMFYAYTRVFVCIYIYTVTDVDTWMLRWLSWAGVFLCEYLYTVEQINKKMRQKSHLCNHLKLSVNY